MFTKKHRLAKTKDVKRTFATGRSFFYPWFVLKFAKNKQENSRFTVVVSTKVSKKSVTRNRIKRVLREFIRIRITQFTTGDYAIIVKPAAGSAEANDLRSKIEEAFVKAKLLNT